MDWLEIDAILLLWLALHLVSFGVNALVGFLNAQGLLSDGVAHGILNFSKAG